MHTLQNTDTARLPALACLALLLALTGCSSDTAKPILECSQPQPLSSKMSIKETRSDIKHIGNRITQDPAGDAISEIIFDLKRQHPSATDADIVNYLVTAYCPVVAAEAWLSKDEATAKVDKFSTQVNEIVSGSTP